MSYIRKRKRNGRIYLEEVESIRINGKVVQKHIRYVGRQVDNQTVLATSISNLSIDKIKLYGPLLVLNHLSREIGLSEILGEHGDEILSMVFAHCIDFKSINQMTKWFERTDLNMLLDLEGLTEERLLKALDSIEAKDPEKLQSEIFANVRKFYNLKTKGVIYDVTNTYFYGRNCSMGKLGKDKSGVKGRPLIQIGMGVTEKEGIPIFHKTFDGNISDSRTLSDLITSFERYNIKQGMIIYDRGIISGKNISELKQEHWNTICGVPANNILKLKVRELVANKQLIDIKKRIRLNDSVFYVFPETHSIGDVNGILLIVYNEQKEKDLRESRYDEILNGQNLLKSRKAIKEGLEKYFYKDGQINKAAISESEEFDGFSFVFSTKSLSTSEVMRLYFQEKDIIEKAFHSLKGIVKLRPIRHWLYNRVNAHVFICYLSYLLLSLLKMRLKDLKISPVKALVELDSLYKVYIRDKKKGFKLTRTVRWTAIFGQFKNVFFDQLKIFKYRGLGYIQS